MRLVHIVADVLAHRLFRAFLEILHGDALALGGGHERRHAAQKRGLKRIARALRRLAAEHERQRAVRFQTPVEAHDGVLRALRGRGGADAHDGHLQSVFPGVFADGHGVGDILGQIAHRVRRQQARPEQQEAVRGRCVHDHVDVFAVVHGFAQLEGSQFPLAALLRRVGGDDLRRFRQCAAVSPLIQEVEQSPMAGGGERRRGDDQAGGHGDGRAQPQFAFHRSFLLLAQSAERILHAGDKVRVGLSKSRAKIPFLHESSSSDSSFLSIARPRRMRDLTVPCARRRAEAISPMGYPSM